jgi:hypothetical protein
MEIAKKNLGDQRSMGQRTLLTLKVIRVRVRPEDRAWVAAILEIVSESKTYCRIIHESNPLKKDTSKRVSFCTVLKAVARYTHNNPGQTMVLILANALLFAALGACFQIRASPEPKIPKGLASPASPVTSYLTPTHPQASLTVIIASKLARVHTVLQKWCQPDVLPNLSFFCCMNDETYILLAWLPTNLYGVTWISLPPLARIEKVNTALYVPSPSKGSCHLSESMTTTSLRYLSS